MKKIAFLLGALSLNAFAGSGYIVSQAEVTKVTSSAGNNDIFRLYYVGGQNDTCSGQVKFFLERSGSKAIFNKAFTLATTALVAGKKIDIFSYTDNYDCNSAITIELRR